MPSIAFASLRSHITIYIISSSLFSNLFLNIIFSSFAVWRSDVGWLFCRRISKSRSISFLAQTWSFGSPLPIAPSQRSLAFYIISVFMIVFFIYFLPIVRRFHDLHPSSRRGSSWCRWSNTVRRSLSSYPRSTSSRMIRCFFSSLLLCPSFVIF